MEIENELRNIASLNGGLIESSRARSCGFSNGRLYRLCKKGVLIRLSKGQYILSDDLEDEYLALSHRSSHLIFSHDTALYFHGLSDRTPFRHTATVPSGKMPSSSLRSACKVFYIQPEFHGLGKASMKTPAGNEVPCYSLERTICDIVRSRSQMGEETVREALKRYAICPQKDLHRLSEIGDAFHMTRILHQRLEMIL